MYLHIFMYIEWNCFKMKDGPLNKNIQLYSHWQNYVQCSPTCECLDTGFPHCKLEKGFILFFGKEYFFGSTLEQKNVEPIRLSIASILLFTSSDIGSSVGINVVALGPRTTRLKGLTSLPFCLQHLMFLAVPRS